MSMGAWVKTLVAICLLLHGSGGHGKADGYIQSLETLIILTDFLAKFRHGSLALYDMLLFLWHVLISHLP